MKLPFQVNTLAERLGRRPLGGFQVLARDERVEVEVHDARVHSGEQAATVL